MDAKVDDWVVTPRRGKAVEINALWYNALRLLEGWVREEQDDDAARRTGRARRARARARSTPLLVRATAATCTTWSTARTATTPRCRPNQIFAISLRAPGARRGALAAGARGRASSGC